MNMSKTKLATALLLAVSAACVSAAVTPDQIDAIFTPLKATNVPGAAVLVVYKGQPVFRRGYGVTDLRTLQPIGPNTGFWIPTKAAGACPTAVPRLAFAQPSSAFQTTS